MTVGTTTITTSESCQYYNFIFTHFLPITFLFSGVSDVGQSVAVHPRAEGESETVSV